MKVFRIKDHLSLSEVVERSKRLKRKMKEEYEVSIQDDSRLSFLHKCPYFSVSCDSVNWQESSPCQKCFENKEYQIFKRDNQR